MLERGDLVVRMEVWIHIAPKRWHNLKILESRWDVELSRRYLS